MECGKHTFCVYVSNIRDSLNTPDRSDLILDYWSLEYCTIPSRDSLLSATSVIATETSCKPLLPTHARAYPPPPHACSYTSSPFLQLLTLPLAAASKLSQIHALYKLKSKGAVSAITWAAVTYGCAGEVILHHVLLPFWSSQQGCSLLWLK